MSLQVHPFSGQAALPFIDELARLRIQVFREFPYLYEGDYEYERNYLQTFLGAPGNLLALAFDGSRVVGASTAMPGRIICPSGGISASSSRKTARRSVFPTMSLSRWSTTSNPRRPPSRSGTTRIE